MKNNTSIIYLTGFMGSGKSTIGKALAKKAKMKFYDLDLMIEEGVQSSISDIFKFKGEAYFRKLESKYLKKLSVNQDTVIALGGGTLIDKKNLEIVLATGTLVYLKSDYASLQKRLEKSKTRPLLKDQSEGQIKAMFKQRAEAYKKAHIQINTKNKSKAQLTKQILSKRGASTFRSDNASNALSLRKVLAPLLGEV